MKILITRTDRIGDVILSLPVAEVLKERYPDAEISFMLRKPLKQLIEKQPYIDKIVIYNNNGGFKKKLDILRTERFDMAIVLFPTFSLSLLLFFAHIPTRIGSGYRWFSFLLNHRLYEHRHNSERHEVEYNLALLKKIGLDESIRKPRLYIDDKEKERAKSFLKSNGIDSGNFLIIHPGSGGSTLSWPLKHYKELARMISNKINMQVVLTGDTTEFVQTEEIRKSCNGNVINIAGKTNLLETSAIISLAKIFIGNSTGPMHIAAAVGTKVAAFFPPSRVNRKTRWRPLSDAFIFEPPVPRCERCIKERCPYYNCLSLITPENVFNGIKDFIKER